MEILVAVVARSAAIDDIQAGEIITIQPDGWGWTPAELENPNWHIISAPILGSHASTLMMDHTPHNLKVGGKTYPRKKHLINFAVLPNPSLFNGVRTQPMVALQGADVVVATKQVA